MTHLPRRTAVLALALVALIGPAAAQVSSEADPQHRTTPIVDLPGPGGPLGFNGYDVYDGQAVAQRFTVPSDGDFRLARVGLFLMNNSDTERRYLRLAVQTDALDEGGTETKPSGRVLESWTTRVETLGWDPLEQFVTSAKGPRLHAGRNYWVVAGSRVQGGVDPVWLFTKRGLEFVTTRNPGGAWWPGAESGALTLRVDAVPIKPH